MITKAATPLRMPRYLTPKTTWYKKRAIKQLSPMLASPKKVRKTTERRGDNRERVNVHKCDKNTNCAKSFVRIDTKGGRSGSYCTRKGGEDIDEHSDAGSTDDSQHHIIVEGVPHLVVEQLRPAIKHLHLAGTKKITFQLYATMSTPLLK